VAARFSGQAQAAQVALIDGVPGGVWAAGGRPIIVFGFTVRDGRVVEIELIADSERLGRLQIEVLS
jgi:RNA polymerase sigma-70 factor (ECF subfamily)